MRQLIAILCLAGIVAADGERNEHDRRLKEVLKGLEHGIKALRMIDHDEEAQHLHKIATEIKRKLGATKERKVAQDELEVLRLAFVACKEAEKGKWAEMLEHAIHARELRLAGRRDKEAVRVYESAPSQGNLIELLMASAELWKKFGHEDKAKHCAKLAYKYRAKWARARKKAESGKRGDLERRIAETEYKIRALQEQIAELKAHLAKRRK